MTTPQKVGACKKQARKLWPKYDPDLDTMINGRKQIHKYVKQSFDDAKLGADFVQLKKEKDLDTLINKQVQKAAKNQSSVVWQANKDLKGDVALNQAQIHNIIEDLYGVKSDGLSKVEASKAI